MNQFWKKFDIKGFTEVSLLEWEGKLTSILFLPKCNLRCPFCHAKRLVLEPEKIETIAFEQVLNYLNTKKGWIDAVVITGGEPTLYEWLFDLIDEIKNIGFGVMIETNGTFPDKIKRLFDTQRLNYIAMDIKAPFLKYKEATGININIGDIKRSIDIIMSGNIDYEFRTTVVPTMLDVDDIIEIAKSIKGAKRFCLQQFQPKDTIDPAYLKVKPYPKDILEKMVKEAERFVTRAVIRNV